MTQGLKSAIHEYKTATHSLPWEAQLIDDQSALALWVKSRMREPGVYQISMTPQQWINSICEEVEHNLQEEGIEPSIYPDMYSTIYKTVHQEYSILAELGEDILRDLIPNNPDILRKVKETVLEAAIEAAQDTLVNLEYLDPAGLRMFLRANLDITLDVAQCLHSTF